MQTLTRRERKVIFSKHNQKEMNFQNNFDLQASFNYWENKSYNKLLKKPEKTTTGQWKTNKEQTENSWTMQKLKTLWKLWTNTKNLKK